jgi:hypothetical protein
MGEENGRRGRLAEAPPVAGNVGAAVGGADDEDPGRRRPAGRPAGHADLAAPLAARTVGAPGDGRGIGVDPTGPSIAALAARRAAILKPNADIISEFVKELDLRSPIEASMDISRYSHGTYINF